MKPNHKEAYKLLAKLDKWCDSELKYIIRPIAKKAIDNLEHLIKHDEKLTRVAGHNRI